jgi:hypothetical protein
VSLDTPKELDCLIKGTLGENLDINRIAMPILNLILNFKGNFQRPQIVWTSASRKGTANAFRWCSSKVPMNVSEFTWKSETASTSQYFAVAIVMHTNIEKTFLDVVDEFTLGLVVCKEQLR